MVSPWIRAIVTRRWPSGSLNGDNQSHADAFNAIRGAEGTTDPRNPARYPERRVAALGPKQAATGPDGLTR